MKNVKRLLSFLAVIAVFHAGEAFAQESPEPITEAQQPEEPAEPQVTVAVNPAGMQRHVRGKWATAAVNVVNPTDMDTEELVAVTIGEDKRVQFARRMWIPANSRRQTWMPVLIPGDIPQTQLQVPMTSIHVKETDEGGEDYQADKTGSPASERSLLLSSDESQTMVFLNRDADNNEDRLKDLSEAIYLGRDFVQQGSQDLGFVNISSAFLPPSPKSLDVVDQIVIASDRILNDSASVTQLRSWLRSGGQMWVMLDQIEPTSVRRLLGDSACFSVVDRVELNAFRMKTTDLGTGEQRDAEQWSSEEPVDFVRVFTDSSDVMGSINGWPVGFRKRVGRGQVIFTTLGARGLHAGGQPSSLYRSLSSQFFEPRTPAPKYSDEMIAFLEDDIGYEIPRRSTIAIILGAQILLILLIGGWLAFRRQLHHLAILVPVVAMSATVVLMALGKRRTSSVPSTIATGQIARVSDEASEIHVDSIVAIYSQRGRDLQIESSSVATTMIDADESGTELKRLEWTDDGRSVWLNIKQPPGVVRHIESEATLPLKKPWSFQGRFTSLGLMGRVRGLNPAKCFDAVIVSPAAPPLAVEYESDSATFGGGPREQMLPGQYANDRFLSDVQRGRQELLRKLLQPASGLGATELSPFGDQPTMLLWTDPIDSGIEFSSGYFRRGSALVSIPVQLQRTREDAVFHVPASFVKIKPYAGSQGITSIFDSRTGRWLSDLDKPSDSELRCELPHVLVPCTIKKANVTIRIMAPSRTLELQGLVNGEYVTLHRKENPTGRIDFLIDNPEALTLDDQGGFRLKVSVTETFLEKKTRLEKSAQETPEERAKQNQNLNIETWGIDYLHVSVEGISHG
ncbi:MAG: hypothetical protein AB8B91_16635 [Rubripirellula sp.]